MGLLRRAKGALLAMTEMGRRMGLFVPLYTQPRHCEGGDLPTEAI